MRTTRRPRLALSPLLSAYTRDGLLTLEALASVPQFGRRVDAVLRARATWLNAEFFERAGDDEFQVVMERFYESVVPAPLFVASLRQHGCRLRRGVQQIYSCTDPISVRLQRCLNGSGVFSVPGLGQTFWSAIAQALDPLRLPAWTPQSVAGARAVGLVQRKNIWYGDLIGACDRLRKRDPRLTATHVDHFFALATRNGSDSHDPFADPIPALVATERRAFPLAGRLQQQAERVAAARKSLTGALAGDDFGGVVAALEMCDPRIGLRARAWDAAALMQWIAWIWHDDDPLAEVTACERVAAGASRCLTSAVLQLRAPERYPLWDSAAAAGLSRLADATIDSYPLYVEAVTALCRRYSLHPLEAPAVLARLASRPA